MSTLPADTSPAMDAGADANAAPAPAGAAARVWTTIGTHGVVDFFSFLIVPLLSVLEGRLDLRPEQGALLLALGSISSGLIQPIVAWASDRLDTRWLGTLGFAVAVVAIGCIGRVTSFEQLVVLQLLAAGGIGAFHPVAAAAVGHMSGSKRGMGLAWFYLAGMVGGVLGNITAPKWLVWFGGEGPGAVEAGLRSFIYLVGPGMLFVFLLAWAIHSAPHRDGHAHRRHAELPAAERASRWFAVGVLYVGNVLRFTVDMALITLLIRWTEQTALRKAGATVLTEAIRVDASQLNGPLQGAKQVGMGIGGLLIGRLIARRFERRALGLVPIAGAAAMATLPFTTGTTAWIVCALAGLSYGGIVPMTMSMAQRLLPHRTSLASGLMLGGAWAVAAVGPPLAQYLTDRWGLERAFAIVGSLMLVAAATALFLPGRTLRDS